ncbi:hypothetical protein [Sphingomonas daechungensis]|uniref:hypothetical protein n=1 Tax=Sphingomonas daechungensis TaxID=1176646 RepID=UPI003783BF90
MRKYWGKVVKRAAKEAGAAVFTSPEKAVISFLLQAGVGLLLYLALGEADVGPEVRIASAFAPFLIFPLIFLWKLLTVPASIYEEQRAEEEQERKGQVFFLSDLYVNESHVDNEALIRRGLALPPEDWINAKLEELNFNWRVQYKGGVQYVTKDVD